MAPSHALKALHSLDYFKLRGTFLSEPIYHHYVSKFYLNKFSVSVEKNKWKTNAFDRVSGEQFKRKLTDKIGGSDHFNKSFSVGDPNDVEKFYARKIETPAGAALKRILDAKTLTSAEDLGHVLLFLAMTAVRNPKARSQIEEPMRYLDGLLSRSALGDEGTEVLEKRQKRDLFPEEHVNMELPQIDPVFESLCKKQWVILEATKETGEFITCDGPLQIIGADDERPWGFESNGAIIFAPLSPTIAIYGKSDKPKIAKLTLNLEAVAAFNLGTLSSAFRLVFYKSDNVYLPGDTDTGVLSFTDFIAKHYALSK